MNESLSLYLGGLYDVEGQINSASTLLFDSFFSTFSDINSGLDAVLRPQVVLAFSLKLADAMASNDSENPYANLDSMFSVSMDLVINTDSPVISKLQAMHGLGNKEDSCNRLAQHIFDQAKLAHGSLDSEGLQRFLAYNSEILTKSADVL